MTRKAQRKKAREQQKLRRIPVTSLPSTALRPSPPWITVGALVASAALSPARPAAALAVDGGQRGGSISSFRRPAVVRLIGPLPEFSHVLAGDDAQDIAARRYDIPAGPLGDALAQFEKVAQIDVTLALESLATIYSPGVSGVHSAEDALRSILAGTSVTFRFTSARTATLDIEGQTEAVEVRGNAPASTVSSPKYPVRLREVPQTIEVIPQAVMKAQGVTTLSEALRNVPGITLQAGEGGGASNTAGDMFNLRGFNASNSIFVDGVRDDGLVSRDIYNLEQVEVFLGPTGTDVGRGTAAGYVNMQTKSPHLTSGTFAQLAYGSADHKRLTFDVNQTLPVGDAGSWLSRSALRLNGMWQDSGVPGRDVVEQGRRAFAPSLALGLGTPTRVVASAHIMRQDGLPDYGIPGAAWEEDQLAPTTVQTLHPVNQSNYYGAAGYDYDDAEQDSYGLRMERDVNPRLTLRNQSRYNRARREAIVSTVQNVAAYDSTTDLVTISRQGNDRENTIFSNQTNASMRFLTRGMNHTASLGLEFASERQVAPTLGGLGTRDPVNIYTPNPHESVLGFAPAHTGAETDGQTDTIALYGFDTVELGRKWQLSGGFRLERYQTEFRSVDAAGLITADIEDDDSLFSGKAGLLYRLGPDGNVYVSYGTSLTPPGSANFGLSSQANNANNPNVEPQFSRSFEVGTKWDVAQGRLGLTAAVFNTRNENVIYTIDALASPPLYNQDDVQTIRGVSIGSVGRITNQWEIFASFTYLDSTFDTQVVANQGNRLTLTPSVAASVWTTYRLPRGFAVGGGVRGTDKVYVNAANTIIAPGYALVDALVEKAINRNLTLRANIYNATNQVYIRNVNNNGGRYNPGQPRSVVVTTDWTF